MESHFLVDNVSSMLRQFIISLPVSEEDGHNNFSLIQM